MVPALQRDADEDVYTTIVELAVIVLVALYLPTITHAIAQLRCQAGNLGASLSLLRPIKRPSLMAFMVGQLNLTAVIEIADRTPRFQVKA